MKFATARIVGTALLACVSVAPARAGTWQPVANPPAISAGVALLLMNGTVMVQDTDAADWWLLSPDATGSYVNGSWRQLASLPVINGVQYAPEYYASAVLPDGKVLIMGGEYDNNQYVDTNLGALYDPVANSWQPVGPPGDGNGAWPRIGDAASVVLPNGTFMLQCGYCGAASGAESALFNEATLGWTIVPGAGMAYPDYQDEQGYTLLPDGSVLTADIWNTAAPNHAERFYQNQWISAGDTPATLHGGTFLCRLDPDQYCNANEIGPAVLRPNGTVVQFGATGQNAIYRPPATPTGTGTWTAASSFPSFSEPATSCFQGTTHFDVADGPAALLPTGSVLVAASPAAYCTPIRFYEMSMSGALKQEAGPAGAQFRSSYEGIMLVLPSGQVLFTDQTSDIEVYTPTGKVNPAWAPAIAKVPATITRGATYPVTGTQFNGLSQGAALGDDAQAATNYPLVRVTAVSGGNVYYCTTASPSTMGVATRKAKVSVNFSCGAAIPAGAYDLAVVANGIASAPVAVTIQ